MSVTLGGAAVVGEGSGAVVAVLAGIFVRGDGGVTFVADGCPGAVAVLSGGAGATVSVAVAAVDIEPGVMVVAVSVGIAVAGAELVAEIVDVVSVVEVVAASCPPQRRSRTAVQAARTTERERIDEPLSIDEER